MTDEEVFELLKQQEELIAKKPVFYIHYDPSTKDLSSIRNFLDVTDPFPYVEMKEEDLSINPDKFNLKNYKLVTIDGKNSLEKIATEKSLITKISDFIYEVPKIYSDTRISPADHPYDLLIEQMNPLGEFRIKLSRLLREKFSLQRGDTHVVCLYVTAVNDPNILYKTLRMTMGELIVNEYYTVPFEDFKGDDVNIFGYRYFEKYLHVDVR